MEVSNPGHPVPQEQNKTDPPPDSSPLTPRCCLTCRSEGSLQGLYEGLDFRHSIQQGLSWEERVDLGGFVAMLTINCHQPGKAVIN